jgi:hypothetical protein
MHLAACMAVAACGLLSSIADKPPAGLPVNLPGGLRTLLRGRQTDQLRERERRAQARVDLFKVTFEDGSTGAAFEDELQIS